MEAYFYVLQIVFEYAYNVFKKGYRKIVKRRATAMAESIDKGNISFERNEDVVGDIKRIGKRLAII